MNDRHRHYGSLRPCSAGLLLGFVVAITGLMPFPPMAHSALLHSPLQEVPVLGHGLFPTPYPTSVGTSINGTKLYAVIPDARIASGILMVESRFDIAAQDVAPPRYFVHGWDTRDYYQSKLVTPPPAPGDPAYGVLWCWLKTPESYPNGACWNVPHHEATSPPGIGLYPHSAPLLGTQCGACQTVHIHGPIETLLTAAATDQTQWPCANHEFYLRNDPSSGWHQAASGSKQMARQVVRGTAPLSL